jgi:probable F420-dependent oxidoreductase
MKIGVNLINFGSDATPTSLIARGRRAEELGYDFLMISDHVAITTDVQNEYPVPFYDPFLTLACLTAETREIELGTSVIVVPYRHPLLIARMSANLDQLSGGRFILGVGVGWSRLEYQALGLDFSSRGAMTDEYLSVIKQAWMTDDFAFDGRFVSFGTVHTGPGPLRKPHPPVWVGGNSPAALRRSLVFGTAWHPLYPTLEWLEQHALPALRAAAEPHDGAIPALAPRLRLQVTDQPLPEDHRAAGRGTLHQIKGDLLRLKALGASHVLLDTYDPDDPFREDTGWKDFERIAELLPVWNS